MSKKNEPVLPKEGYTYHKLSYTPDDYNFGIKEVNDEDAAVAWLKAYSKLSKSDWRVQRTYSSAGRFVIFKKDFRCCHFTDRRVRGIKSSKHTGCPAQLHILISVYNEKSKRPNHLAKVYPCTVRLKNAHNHASDYSEIYAANLAASFKCRRKPKKPKEDVIYVREGVVEDLGWAMPLPDNASVSDDNDGGCHDVDFSSDIENGGVVNNDIAREQEMARCAEQTEALSGIREIFNRIENGIRSNPDVFLPAAKKMLQNASKFGATEAGLVTAMHTFAAYKVVQRALKSKKAKARRKRKPTDTPKQPRKNRKAPVNPMSPRKNCNSKVLNPMNPNPNPRPQEIVYDPYGKFGPSCAERAAIPFNPRPPEVAMETYGQFEAARAAGPGWGVPPNQQPNAYGSGGNYSMPYVM